MIQEVHKAEWPNRKGTKAESKLSSPECKYIKVFFIQIFSHKTVRQLEN